MTKHKYPDGERVYIVFDARAASGDTDDAVVLECLGAKSNRAARKEAHGTWGGQPYVLWGNTFKDGVAIADDAPLYKHWC